MNTITVEQLHKKHESDHSITLLDVRSPMEFRATRIPFATNVPLGKITQDALSGMVQNDDTVYVVCLSGARSAMACQKLSTLGFINVVNVAGGTSAWAAAGFPVAGDRASGSGLSIFSPTGVLIAAGIVLSLTLHPGFLILPALAGLYWMRSGKKAKASPDTAHD